MSLGDLIRIVNDDLPPRLNAEDLARWVNEAAAASVKGAVIAHRIEYELGWAATLRAIRDLPE